MQEVADEHGQPQSQRFYLVLFEKAPQLLHDARLPHLRHHKLVNHSPPIIISPIDHQTVPQAVQTAHPQTQKTPDILDDPVQYLHHTQTSQ